MTPETVATTCEGSICQLYPAALKASSQGNAMDCFENTVKACLGLHPTNTALEAIEVLVVGVDLRNA